jgi:hypothetical protein|tara:strand:+ start:10546 stop:10980 length:435 start_codon:yes stop_codon:yes gene_type:complete
MSLNFIKENEWDHENIENRIDNEARVLGIRNFNLFKDDIDVNFTGSLRLIDAIKIIYELEDSSFNMHKECKTVLSLSKNNKIDMFFTINRKLNTCIVTSLKINSQLSEDENKQLNDFSDHIVLMLNIWKSAMIKRWSEYFVDEQ